MLIEKTKSELLVELNGLRSEIDAKKAERKALAEREKVILADAKKKGISLSSENYTRSESIADAILSLSNGEPFTVSSLAGKGNSLFVGRGKKDNGKESETVSRLLLPFATKIGLVEKTGKDSYRFVGPVAGRKVA